MRICQIHSKTISNAGLHVIYEQYDSLTISHGVRKSSASKRFLAYAYTGIIYKSINLGEDYAGRRPIFDAHFSSMRPDKARQTRSPGGVRTRKFALYSRRSIHSPTWRRLYRECNLVPRTVCDWKEKFLAGGRSSPDGLGVFKQARLHAIEVASPKRIIDEYAVANDALKKRSVGGAI